MSESVEVVSLERRICSGIVSCFVVVSVVSLPFFAVSMTNHAWILLSTFYAHQFMLIQVYCPCDMAHNKGHFLSSLLSGRLPRKTGRRKMHQ